MLKDATYGAPSHADRLIEQFKHEHGYIDDARKVSEDLAESHEQNVQSFAEPPPPEPEISRCSIEEA